MVPCYGRSCSVLALLGLASVPTVGRYAVSLGLARQLLDQRHPPFFPLPNDAIRLSMAQPNASRLPVDNPADPVKTQKVWLNDAAS